MQKSEQNAQVTKRTENEALAQNYWGSFPQVESINIATTRSDDVSTTFTQTTSITFVEIKTES